MKTQSNILYINEESRLENPDYLNKQIITYIGNKRALLGFINEGLNTVKKKLDRNKLDIFDVFSGSGIVSRFFKKHSDKLIVNDLEKYSQTINQCFLANQSDLNLNYFSDIYNEVIFKLENEKLREGLISNTYAPQNDNIIEAGERAFYTLRNARYLDTARQLIESVEPTYKSLLLAPLLAEASIHANTSGVFKGFYKDSATGIGKYGGSNGDALLRILGDIHLPFPLFSNFECDIEIHRGDSNQISKYIDEVDLAYIDPPYNQHPYGSNYFMLNLLVDYIKPNKLSKVSGIPTDWNRSEYNNNKKSIDAFKDLVTSINAKYLLISFNSEGFISFPEMMAILSKIGTVDLLETKYNTFRGSRNLRNRNIHVKEYLYLVEKYN